MKDPLVWMDLEMTGLRPDREVIVEIAVVITDAELDEVIEGPDLVIGAPDDILERMDPYVVTMHNTSGLIQEIRASRLTVAEAEAEVLDFVRTHVPGPRSAPLAGNSVHTDREFLQQYMPKLAAHLHYRNVDVSTLKELARRWYPTEFAEVPKKTGDHRALADILESIAELRYYRGTVFR